MAYTDIDKSDDYFNTKLYTGNGSTQSITGVGFQPDWVWIKNRSSVTNHEVADVVRGANKLLKTNDTDAEQSISTKITSFDSDGFGIGSDANVNGSGNSLVAWNWLASNTTASNTDGSITSTVSANTTSGFSIVSYTGTGATATVGHGLGVAPNMVIIKNRTDNVTWIVGHDYLHSDPWNDRCLHLDTTSAFDGNLTVWSTPPTSTLVNLGFDNSVNGSSDNMIAYCFAEKKGFSKFGSYTGNGSTDGTFVFTGFSPAFVMCKRTDSTGVWFMCDNKRVGFNGRPNNTATVGNPELSANDSRSEAAGNTNVMDIFSNGFKLIQSGAEINGSGASFIFMAFAENPFVTSTGIPTCAR